MSSFIENQINKVLNQIVIKYLIFINLIFITTFMPV